MSRPVIGIIGNSYLINEEYPVYAAGKMNASAVRDVCDALPLVVPSDPGCADVADLVDALNTETLATVASCSGHGHRPGVISLADGRQLMVFDSLEHSKPVEWRDSPIC